MKITPLEIRQHAFEKIFRGYNIEEVDSFLANVSQEWDRVLNESKMLRMQLEIAEKEASKLREIEMTLFKTLKTAEDTSTMITDQANQQAEKYMQEAHSKSESIINEAKARANEIVRAAETRAKYIKEEVLGEVKGLERDFRTMDNYKDNLLVQMKSLANATLDHVERFESKFDKEGIQAKFKEATAMIEEDAVVPAKSTNPATIEAPKAEITIPEIVLETTPETVLETTPVAITESVPEAIHETLSEVHTNVAHLTEPVSTIAASLEESVSHTEKPLEVVPEEKPRIEVPPVVEPIHMEVPQTIVEAIAEPAHAISEPTPEAEEVTPVPTETIVEPVVPAVQATVYKDNLKDIEGIGPKIEEILNDAGILTFRDLATTQGYKVKDILLAAGSHFASHDPTTWAEQAKLAAEGRWEDLKVLQDRLYGGRPEDFTELSDEKEPEPVKAAVTAKDQITEEMLEKVNKVKAAIRKSMLEKADNAAKDHTPLPTVKDVVNKQEGGSFFDNL